MTLVDYRRTPVDYAEEVTLLDLADRLLEKGVVVGGELVISLAGVDLVYLNLRALIASVDASVDLHLGRGTGR
jgi:hypothetical protein